MTYDISRIVNKMTYDITSRDLLHMTTEIVKSYISAKGTDFIDIPEIISCTFNELCLIAREKVTYQKPAVPIDQSFTDDYIICLEDGKKLKMLKRHLKNKYNMTIYEYKNKWGLDSNYPTTSPSYAKKRSNIAKITELGKRLKQGKK